MTTKDYCFSLKTSGSIDKNTIVSHLETLFRNKKFEGAFLPTEKIPIDIGVADLWKTKKSVCLDIKTRAQQTKKRINKLLRDITNPDLVINSTLRLEKPVDVKVCDLDRFKQGKGAVRWKTLEHNGPYFKHLYESPADRLGVSLIYDGKSYEMTPEEEEVASFYAKRIITEEKSTKKYLDKKEFNVNFFNDFKTYFSPEHKKIFKNFKSFDFSNLVTRIKQIKEQKDTEKKRKREEREAENQRKKKMKGKDKPEEKEDVAKKEERISKLEKKLNFSFAYVDNVKKDIRNSAVEMPGLYVGSGDNMTNKGKVKQKYYPKDITINVSSGSAPNPPKGYKWGEIVNDQTANWTARYRDKTTNAYKYILLAETGDLLKFEKARKLNKYIGEVDKRINSLLKAKSVKENQIGCALYLIKEYGIRVGNECDDDCDTKEKVVGATTLMVQNVECRKESSDFYIDLSFKGKDSVSYDNTLSVNKQVYDHISSFLKKKKGSDNVFDEISSNDVNKYLKSIDKDFSAKVFRTRLASSIMYDGLKVLDYDDDATDSQKISDFNKVNRVVAIKLNHKKGLTDAMKEKLKKDREKIVELKEKLKSEKDAKKKNKLKDDIASKEFQLNERDESKEIALDTSKKNYIDPRIIKAWAEHVNLGGCNDDEDEEEEDEDEDEEKIAKHCVDKIYTKALLKHFRWAIEDSTFNEEWDYEDTELDCIVGEDLDPENGEVIVKKDEDLKKKCIKKVAKDFGVTEELVKKLIK